MYRTRRVLFRMPAGMMRIRATRNPGILQPSVALEAPAESIPPRRGYSSRSEGEPDKIEPIDGLDGGQAPRKMTQFPREQVRNVSIIAHVDHGKSTLSNRILERTRTLLRPAEAADLASEASEQLYMDKLQVEKERGITVKAQTATVFYRYRGQDWMVNLIDTPGHVDFSSEVRRSLTACQGAVLLVDASEGVQAQTLAHFYLAFESNLALVPVLNKIDLPTAQPEPRRAELEKQFGFHPSEIILASGKAGLGIDDILCAIVDHVPPPGGKEASPLRALLFDSWFDTYRGVVCLVAVVDGALLPGARVLSVHSQREYRVEAVGIMHPERVPTDGLRTGQVGYVVLGMRTAREALVGDTLVDPEQPSAPLPGYKPSQPMVYASLYCLDGTAPDELKTALEKLTLTDSSVVFVPEHSDALGYGYRCGFLGLLHMEVVLQRLEQEFGAAVVASLPTVPYRVEMDDGSELTVESPSAFPSNRHSVRRFLEPFVHVRIVCPRTQKFDFLHYCRERRADLRSSADLDEERVRLDLDMPLSEIICDFVDAVKTLSSGYASVEYEEGPYVESDLVKVQILLNGVPADPLSSIVHRSQANSVSRASVAKLRGLMRRQQFEVAIQASVDGKIIARETLKAFRKDVTAKLYGGDVTRRMKLLEKQKEGKKRMKQIGNVQIDQDVFQAMLKR